jgi:formyltetrahydrofolate deformylase
VDEHQHIARLLVSCPDRHGIVAAVSGFLAASDANILSADQHSTDPEGGTLFMRMEFRLEGFRTAAPISSARSPRTSPRRSRCSGASRTRTSASVRRSSPRATITASSTSSGASRRGELDTEVVAVISNHPDHATDVAGFGVPYHHVPVARDAKADAEDGCWSCWTAAPTSSCSRATCRSSRAISSTGSACR